MGKNGFVTYSKNVLGKYFSWEKCSTQKNLITLITLMATLEWFSSFYGPGRGPEIQK